MVAKPLLFAIMVRSLPVPRDRSLAGKVLGRQKTVPEDEKVRIQAEVATTQAAAEEARFDLARTLAAVRSPLIYTVPPSACVVPPTNPRLICNGNLQTDCLCQHWAAARHGQWMAVARHGAIVGVRCLQCHAAGPEDVFETS